MLIETVKKSNIYGCEIRMNFLFYSNTIPGNNIKRVVYIDFKNGGKFIKLFQCKQL